MIVSWWNSESAASGAEKTGHRSDVGGRDAPETPKAMDISEDVEPAAKQPQEGTDDATKPSAESWEQGHCREVAFPKSFTSKKVMLYPQLNFFRNACCPDLDFEGQGLASSSTPAPGGDTNSTRRELGSAGAKKTVGQHSRIPTSTTPRLVLDLFDWLGAASCGLETLLCRRHSQKELHLSTFQTPCHLQYHSARTVCVVRLRGLIAPPVVRACVEAAKSVATCSTAASAETNDKTGANICVQRSAQQCKDVDNLDGCSWGSVTAWPFRDAPRAYSAPGAKCGGGELGKHRRRVDENFGPVERAAEEWPVGGHGIYSVLACPGGSAAAFISARCPGPGW